jgi:hypothetical protein
MCDKVYGTDDSYYSNVSAPQSKFKEVVYERTLRKERAERAAAAEDTATGTAYVPNANYNESWSSHSSSKKGKEKEDDAENRRQRRREQADKALQTEDDTQGYSAKHAARFARGTYSNDCAPKEERTILSGAKVWNKKVGLKPNDAESAAAMGCYQAADVKWFDVANPDMLFTEADGLNVAGFCFHLHDIKLIDEMVTHKMKDAIVKCSFGDEPGALPWLAIPVDNVWLRSVFDHLLNREVPSTYTMLVLKLISHSYRGWHFSAIGELTAIVFDLKRLMFMAWYNLLLYGNQTAIDLAVKKTEVLDAIWLNFCSSHLREMKEFTSSKSPQVRGRLLHGWFKHAESAFENLMHPLSMKFSFNTLRGPGMNDYPLGVEVAPNYFFPFNMTPVEVEVRWSRMWIIFFMVRPKGWSKIEYYDSVVLDPLDLAKVPALSHTGFRKKDAHNGNRHYKSKFFYAAIDKFALEISRVLFDESLTD